MKYLQNPMLVVFTLLIGFYAAPATAGFSGDPAIDATILPAFVLRAGGSSPGIDRGSNVWRCGPNNLAAHPLEQQCPNTATFAPAAATGGKQSWGVGATYVFFENFEVICGVQLQPIFVWYWPYFIFDWQLECHSVPMIFPGGTFGQAMIILEWGPDNDLTDDLSSQPTSLMAYHPNSLADCVPDVIAAQVGLDAKCTASSISSTINSSYVQEDNGYEADIRMTDNGCNTLTGKRLHGPSDYDANCLTYFQSPQMSNFPGDYQDTTILDDENEFNIGFGSSDGAGLQAGETYVLIQSFRSRAQPLIMGTLAKHEGAITTEVDTALTILGICSPLSFAGCFFTVNDASVGGPFGDVFTQVIP